MAVELPTPLREALADTQATLRGELGGRYVAPDSFHVTLAFLGEVEGARLPALAQICGEVFLGHAPFRATLAGLGCFKDSSRAVLWQGFDRGAKELGELAHDLRARLADEGFAFDRTGFLPHVTLMRRVDLSCGALPMPQVATGTIDTVTLFRSDLSGEFPRYSALERYTLTSWDG